MACLFALVFEVFSAFFVFVLDLFVRKKVDAAKNVTWVTVSTYV